MKMIYSSPFLRLCLLTLFALLPIPAVCSPSGKLIATGWDSPTPSEFRKHILQFENSPFDGTTIYPTVKGADGSTHSNGHAFNHEKWEAEACRDMIADLQAVDSRVKADSFLFCYANPGNVDWFDDAGWTEIVDHWRQLARAARLGGLRGLLFDAEPYTMPHEQFNDTRQPETAKHSFADYTAKARQRGQAVMRAVASEFPNATLFSYRLLSDLLSLTGQGGEPRQALSGNTYALLPAFVDGWFDAAPPTITLIEGNEDIGYRANNPQTFENAYTRLRTALPSLLDPVHAAKFRSQMLISHGLYLDAYINAPGSSWYIDSLGGTPAARLEANVSAALSAADSGYVWIYGEKARWWAARASGEKYPPWSEKFPGVETALRRAKDPVAAARTFLKTLSPAANLLKNADFATRAADLPLDWWTWQEEGSHGQPALEANALRWSGAQQATFGQNVPITPDARYAVGAKLRSEGHGTAFISIGWKNADGKWSHAESNVQILPSATDKATGWSEAYGLVTAPKGSATMIVMFIARGQSSPQDHAWYRDLQCAVFRNSSLL